MDVVILKVLFSRQSQSVSGLIRASGRSSYSCYRLMRQLGKLGVLTFHKGRIGLVSSPTAHALKQLVFSGFDTSVFGKRGLSALVLLLEPRTVHELSVELGLSFAQTNQLVNKLAQFLGKKGNRFVVSEKYALLIEFLKSARASVSEGVFWKNREYKLLRVPRAFSFRGALTAFSRFGDFGVPIETETQYVVQPVQELTVDKVLVHALKFSQNANDVALCIVFYLKNKQKIDVEKLEKEANKFEVTELWQDLVSWLEDLPQKNPEFFLPRHELAQKAKLYGVLLPERFGLSFSQKILLEAGKKLKVRVRVFLIGGSALMEYGLKNSTKDIDLVVLDTKSAKQLVKAFNQMGFFAARETMPQYEQLGTAFILEKPRSPRIDLFVKKICKCLEFSSGMVKRSERLLQGNLELYKASLEDIFLLKSVSSRDADIVDCLSILSKRALDWKTVEREILGQEKNFSQLKELLVLEHLEAMEKRLGIQIPIKNKILRKALEKSVLYVCSKPCSVKEIKQKIDFPEYTIRNTVNRLVKQKKLLKLKEKPSRYKTRK